MSAPVTAPGFYYDMDAPTYHADPCPAPSLSHTIARILHTRSPLHAKRRHPRLGGLPQRVSAEMAIGAAAHALTLGRGSALARIDAENYRTKDAQNQRDAAFAQGFTPLLAKEYAQAEYMAHVARPALELVCGARIENLRIETVAIATEPHDDLPRNDFRDNNDTWLRCMTDAATPDFRLIVDYKTCATAEPESFGANVRKYYATQRAFYEHVLDCVDPDGRGKRRFLFMAQERDCPEAIVFFEADPALTEIAGMQMARARRTWAECLLNDAWPAYDPGPHLVAPMPWEIDAEISAEYDEQLKESANV